MKRAFPGLWFSYIVFSMFPINVFSFSPPASLTLGFIGPTNETDTNALTGGQDSLFAFKLAIQHVNDLTQLLPKTKLNFVWNDSRSDAGICTILAFWQCSDAQVIGIVGEQNSVYSEVLI